MPVKHETFSSNHYFETSSYTITSKTLLLKFGVFAIMANSSLQVALEETELRLEQCRYHFTDVDTSHPNLQHDMVTPTTTC